MRKKSAGVAFVVISNGKKKTPVNIRGAKPTAIKAVELTKPSTTLSRDFREVFVLSVEIQKLTRDADWPWTIAIHPAYLGDFSALIATPL
jgi:hypothetical protein